LLVIEGIHGDKVVLSEVELTVIWFFMTGMKMEEIAERTGLKKQSVSYFKRKVMRKIGAENSSELIVWYLSQRNYLCKSDVYGLVVRRFDKRR